MRKQVKKKVLLIITDIHERKEFEMALRFKNEELVAAEEELKATNDELKYVNEEIQRRNIDLRKINDKLIDSEEKFRELAENTNDAFWLRDQNDLIYINPSFEKVWGRSRSEIFDNPQNLDKWVHPDDRNRYSKWIDFGIFSNLKTFSEQYRIIKSDGSIRWLWSRIHPVYDGEGKVYRIAGIASDITEQKETEDALVRAKEKAMESDNLKSAFLANISHEIRTPMNGILGFIELLNDPTLDSAIREQYIGIISKSSKQLLQIINDIIDISKIEANQVKIDTKECNINSAMRDIYLFYQNDKVMLEKSNLLIKLDLPLEEEYAKVYSDESRLRQILMNLLDNAFKFTFEGEIVIGYKISDNKNIEFYIKDTGIGIPIEQYHLVFERFRQVDDSSTRKFGGTGLGLSISEGLVKLMGGNIWFESEPDKGSTFYFTLPYLPVNRRIIEPEPETLQQEPKLNDKIILIVEDDEINFEYLYTILEPTEAIIIHAGSGEDAIRVFSSNKDINLILMDIRLPGISGYEAMKAIKEQNPSIPIIAQTAFAMAEDNLKCLEQGFDDYIAKPINRKLLIRMIQKQIYYQ
ncbi:MAG: response regulator [Bacteroidetes bacterium]|nr:response regulator [Bacteroidota bacterium]